jgi:hypothetical protein
MPTYEIDFAICAIYKATIEAENEQQAQQIAAHLIIINGEIDEAKNPAVKDFYFNDEKVVTSLDEHTSIF